MVPPGLFSQDFLAGGSTTMRIYGPNGTTLGTPASNARRTSSTGFSLPDAAAAPETRSAAPPKAAASMKSSSGDPGLDTVLSEIELRVEVELAKAGRF